MRRPQLRNLFCSNSLSKLSLVLHLLASALILSGCGSVPERKLYRGGSDHLPLLDGRVMRYRERADGESTEYSLTLKFLGGRTWKVYEATDDDIPYGVIEFSSDGKIVEVATLTSLTSLESRKDISFFDQVWVDEGADVDSVWTDPTVGTESLVAGYETVTVPAGTYEECLKMVATPLPELMDSVNARYERDESDEQLYLEEKEAAGWQTVRWFAHSVGLVKEQIGPPGDPRIVRELIAVVAEGAGDADTLLQER